MGAGDFHATRPVKRRGNLNFISCQKNSFLYTKLFVFFKQIIFVHLQSTEFSLGSLKMRENLNLFLERMRIDCINTKVHIYF